MDRSAAVMKKRVVDPELLDSLPDQHPDATASRDELLIVNHLMRNHAWVLRRLREQLEPGWRILELGAGDGALGARIVEAGLCEPECLTGMDLAPRPEGWPKKSEWIQGHLLNEPWPACEVVVANLILHQFQDDQLRQIGSRIPATTRVILSCDPIRSWCFAILGALFCKVGEFHAVTRYDMQVSIRAGFRGDELPHLLGLDPKQWRIDVSRNLLGAYHLLAWRQEDGESDRSGSEEGGRTELNR